MNTRKQVFVMTALILVAVITLGIYGAWDSGRASSAEADFEEATIERASRIFGQNCRLCHGDVGQGGALGGRLPAAPALDRPDLQGFIETDAALLEDVSIDQTELRVTDATAFTAGQTILINEERMTVESIAFDTVPAVVPTAAAGEEEPEAVPVPGTLTVVRAQADSAAQTHFAEDDILVFDKGTLDVVVIMLKNTITCGRVGTAMPAWSQSQNGPLSDEQIRQLTVLITTGHWEVVSEEVDHEDELTTELLAPIGIEDTTLQVKDVLLFEIDAYVRVNGERMKVIDRPKVDPNADDKSGIVTVERAVLGTTPLEHDIDSELFRFPGPPQDPATNAAACGQTARPAAPAEPPGLIEPFDGQEVEITAFGLKFDLDEITLETGGQVRVRLDNQDAATQHNIAFYISESDKTPVSATSVGTIFEGPEMDDTVFDVPDAGEYYFECDVHPAQMNGTLIVE